jgi:hypothetical protein
MVFMSGKGRFLRRDFFDWWNLKWGIVSACCWQREHIKRANLLTDVHEGLRSDLFNHLSNVSRHAFLGERRFSA